MALEPCSSSERQFVLSLPARTQRTRTNRTHEPHARTRTSPAAALYVSPARHASRGCAPGRERKQLSSVGFFPGIAPISVLASLRRIARHRRRADVSLPRETSCTNAHRVCLSEFPRAVAVPRRARDRERRGRRARFASCAFRVRNAKAPISDLASLRRIARHRRRADVSLPRETSCTNAHRVCLSEFPRAVAVPRRARDRERRGRRARFASCAFRFRKFRSRCFEATRSARGLDSIVDLPRRSVPFLGDSDRLRAPQRRQCHAVRVSLSATSP